VSEFNFRVIVNLHLEDLLLIECKYWRKRCTIRWFKLSEDNTKCFHAMATQRMRRNSISMLKAEDGRVVSGHDEMAGLLWASFKDRMDRSQGIDMKFDLSRLVQKIDCLEELTLPFSTEEMDLVIKKMPADRAPGPDGFNGLFLKRCWHLIKSDFYALAHSFHDGSINLQSINGSYIVLVPKVGSPECVNDYRPIFSHQCLPKISNQAGG
jgi:hypothetical protein